ncbi:MAG: fibronectin type III domain-containing protein, partial [Candidatus Omnitrophica bacterium]|nr:fibronectin type III domain-containing protein [Candidatus Omnitrophota bacterium]
MTFLLRFLFRFLLTGFLAFFIAASAFAQDTTPPTAPPRPTEGTTADLDYDADGSYTIYWGAATDPESGIAAYELQEAQNLTGPWSTLTSTNTTRNHAVTSRIHNTRYYYQVRAKNGDGLWGAFSAVSDGILIDTTAPSAVTVTDDGATQTDTASLHATWTASTDAESGIQYYQYQIRKDATNGTIIVNWTSTGLATDVTHTGLTLNVGTTYFFAIRSRNNAGKYSTTRYSDGIRILFSGTDPTPPTTPPTP